MPRGVRVATAEVFFGGEVGRSRYWVAGQGPRLCRLKERD